MKMAPDTSKPGRDRRTFAAAARFTGVVVAISLVVLFASLAWLAGCKSGTGDQALAHCSALQRNVLAIGAPAVLAVGGVAAFVETYRVWRDRGGWWIWQGAGWFLMVLMTVVLAMTAPAALL